MTNAKRWPRAIVASVFAVLVATTPALAAGSQTVVVLGTITVTGAPAAIDFGTGGPTDVKTSSFNVVVTTNNPTGYILRANNGILISGANSILRTQQSWDGTPGAGCGVDCVNLPPGSMPGTFPTSSVNIGSRPAASSAGGDTWALVDSLTLPNVAPGTYVGNDGNGNGFTVFAVTQ